MSAASSPAESSASTRRGRTLGVIGGSGIYTMPGLDFVGRHEVQTPFGAPSDAIIEAELDGTRLFFLPRHGQGHRLAPHAINFRANMCALKMLGAEQVVSLSAVGSLREHIHPGDVVIVDQYIDLTKRRISTFFDEDIVAHVSFADPVCPALSEAAAVASEVAGARVFRGGTYVCIEGPQFSTRSESHLYRSWGASVIGMTAMPEAKLAREAELPYATVAFATDYDAWHETEEAVSVEVVLAVLRQNAARAQQIVRELASRLPDPAQSTATTALAHAVITPPEHAGAEARARLAWLLGKRS
jgi:5'-methylthioadenosine phosphorylase